MNAVYWQLEHSAQGLDAAVQEAHPGLTAAHQSIGRTHSCSVFFLAACHHDHPCCCAAAAAGWDHIQGTWNGATLILLGGTHIDDQKRHLRAVKQS